MQGQCRRPRSTTSLPVQRQRDLRATNAYASGTPLKFRIKQAKPLGISNAHGSTDSKEIFAEMSRSLGPRRESKKLLNRALGAGSPFPPGYKGLLPSSRNKLGFGRNFWNGPPKDEGFGRVRWVAHSGSFLISLGSGGNRRTPL